MSPVVFGQRAARVGAAACALTLTLLAVPVACAEEAPPLSAAAEAYGEGHYQEASRDLERIIAARGYSAPLLFDLGNAYLRDGKAPLAIVQYERAQLLAPRDAAIAENLAAARTAASSSDGRGRLGRAVRWLSIDEWIWGATALLWLTVLAFGMAWAARRRRGVLLAWGTAAALMGASSAGAAAVEGRDLHRGIVLPSAPVLVSPFPSSQSDRSLSPGSPVQLGRTHGDYVFVTDAQGKTGWLDRAQVEPIMPRTK